MKAIVWVEKAALTVLILVVSVLLFPVVFTFSVAHDVWFCCVVAKDCTANLWNGEWR